MHLTSYFLFSYFFLKIWEVSSNYFDKTLLVCHHFSICNMHSTSYLVFSYFFLEHKCFLVFYVARLSTACRETSWFMVGICKYSARCLCQFYSHMTYFIGHFFLFVFCRMLFSSLVLLQSRESKSMNISKKKSTYKHWKTYNNKYFFSP